MQIARAVQPLANVQKQLDNWDATFALLSDTKMELSGLVTGLQDVSAKLTEREEKEKAAAVLREKKEVLEFLCKIDGFQRHLDVTRRRQKGTATWFAEGSAVQEWIQQPSESVVWCHGIPGCGKSILVSAVVDCLLGERIALGCAVGVAYLSHDNPAMHNVQFILATVLRQVAEILYTRSSSTREAIESLRAACQTPVKRPPTDKECLDLLTRLAESRAVLYLCFDALDEIPETTLRELLKALAVLQRSPKIGLLLASRDHVKLGQLSRTRSVPVSASDDDVRLYLEVKIDEAVGSVLHEEAGGQDWGENEER